MATPMYGPFGLGLEYWTYKRLLREVLVDIDTTIQWCKRNGLLARSQECNACSIPMHWEVYDRGIDGYRWRCPNKCCRKVKSIRHDSWFSQSHLTLEQILEVTFLWTEDMSGETVCAVYMDQIETEKIGGVGKVVEIDESKFGKRKYNRGRRREGQWVLGGVERGSEEMFMQIVPSRDAATLLPVIIANVKPGTEIHTDEWRSYARLNRRGYVHHTVNHSIEFVNPANGAHTQSIECTWAHAKKKYKKMHGTSKALFPTYLLEFIWRRKIAKDTPFAMLMNCITVVYPL
eukprot:Em0001g1467a